MFPHSEKTRGRDTQIQLCRQKSGPPINNAGNHVGGSQSFLMSRT